MYLIDQVVNCTYNSIGKQWDIYKRQELYNCFKKWPEREARNFCLDLTHFSSLKELLRLERERRKCISSKWKWSSFNANSWSADKGKINDDSNTMKKPNKTNEISDINSFCLEMESNWLIESQRHWNAAVKIKLV